MAVPKLRFKSFNGSYQRKKLSELLTERNEKSCITENLPLLSFTIEGGVINPDEKKTNKRDIDMLVGKKIRELRDEQGVLKRQLAAILEIVTTQT